MAGPETISATLVNLRFHNTANGFAIAQFQSEKKLFTCKGTLLNPEINLEYKLTGHWIDDPKWGRQFVIKMYEVVQPSDVDGIYRYLVRIAKWVGPSTGTEMVKMYGDQTLEVLKSDPERVDKDIKGITLERAKEIQKNLIDNAAMEKTMVILEGMLGANGINRNAIVGVVKKWSGDAPGMIKESPYILTQIHGVGFLSADRVALAIGFDPKSMLRQKAAVLHILNEQIFSMGHTWLKLTDTVDEVMALIGYRIEQEIIDTLVEENRIVVDKRMLTTKEIYAAEIGSAALLWGMAIQYKNRKETDDI